MIEYSKTSFIKNEVRYELLSLPYYLDPICGRLVRAWKPSTHYSYYICRYGHNVIPDSKSNRRSFGFPDGGSIENCKIPVKKRKKVDDIVLFM